MHVNVVRSCDFDMYNWTVVKVFLMCVHFGMLVHTVISITFLYDTVCDIYVICEGVTVFVLLTRFTGILCFNVTLPHFLSMLLARHMYVYENYSHVRDKDGIMFHSCLAGYMLFTFGDKSCFTFPSGDH